MQGMGWIALEELKWGDSSHKWIRPGNLFTCGPGAYKIPSVNDIPLKFKVSILKVHPCFKFNGLSNSYNYSFIPPRPKLIFFFLS